AAGDGNGQQLEGGMQVAVSHFARGVLAADPARQPLQHPCVSSRIFPASTSTQRPGGKSSGREMEPKRTRIRRLTRPPAASTILRTSLLRPSASTTRYQRLDPASFRWAIASSRRNFAGP